MWLVEDRVQLPSDYNRKIIKREIHRILTGYSISLQGRPTIEFVESGVKANGEIVETKCGPDRNYLDSNPFEICICICKTKNFKINNQLLMQVAKEIRKAEQMLKGNDFEETCNNINILLQRHNFELVILYVEQKWVRKNKAKQSSQKNFTTIITHLKNKKIQSLNSVNEEGCYVLYGI